MLQYRMKNVCKWKLFSHFTFIPTRFRTSFCSIFLTDIYREKRGEKIFICPIKDKSLRIDLPSLIIHLAIFHDGATHRCLSLVSHVFAWSRFRDSSCYELRHKQRLGNVLGYIAMDARWDHGSLHELSAIQLRDTDRRASGVSSILQGETWTLYARTVQQNR